MRLTVILRNFLKRSWQTTWFAAIFFVFVLSGSLSAITLRIATQNALNYSGSSSDLGRAPNFRTIVRNIHPDLYCMQEITSETGVDQLLSQVFLQVNNDWAAAPFHNGYDTDNAFFYRTSKLQLVSSRFIGTTLRDIAEYTVRPATGDTSLRLKLYSLHLKANSGSGSQTANIERRRQDAVILRSQLNQLAAGSLFMVCGDYNLLYSDEPAYQALLSDSIPRGRCWDPINTPGNWEYNPAFAAVHTIGSDGLTARFDFILTSTALMDSSGSYIIRSSYTPYGNDGRHYNRAVNSLPNYSVADSIANALVAASDHLPVFADFVFEIEASSSVRNNAPENYHMLNCYPNPFNPSLTIEIAPLHEPATLTITDVNGREIMSRVLPMNMTAPLHVDFSDQASGQYFVRVKGVQHSAVQRVTLVR
jgi:endonuclease/exonuclease/phosphatase family metal-dependent hydrolase